MELAFTGLKMLPVLWGIGVLMSFVTAPNGFIHISLLLFNEGKPTSKNIGSLIIGVNSYLAVIFPLPAQRCPNQTLDEIGKKFVNVLRSKGRRLEAAQTFSFVYIGTKVV